MAKSTKVLNPVLRHAPLSKLLLGLYAAKVPTMIWSDPGVGKTSTVKQIGEILNVPTVMRSGNKSDPTDFSGIPYLTGGDTNKEMRMSLPTYVKELDQAKNGILFFDEINTCPQQIQNALLSIIQDCQYSEFTIPRTTFRVAAGNYVETAGNRQMSAALANRFIHLFAEADVEYWCAGFISGFRNYEVPKINKLGSEAQVQKLLKYRLAMVDFMKQHPDYLKMTPKEMINREDVAYPSPRSWDNASVILSVLDENEPEFVNELICGVLGTQVGPLFLNFTANYKGLGIELEDYVGKETKFRLPDPDAHDQVSKIMASMVYYLGIDPKKYLPLWMQVINVLFNQDKKYGNYPSYRNLIMAYLGSNLTELVRKKVITATEVKTKIREGIDGYDDLSPYIGF